MYEKFAKAYRNMNKKLGKKQYMVPYLMSSHPGSHLKEAIALAEYIRDLGYIARTRYRTFIRHREPFLLVCIIRDLTQEQ